SNSAAHASRFMDTAATDAVHKPPKGSQITSPSLELAAIILSIRSNGFWFRCEALSLVGRYVLGAERFILPRYRSFPRRLGRSHTFVTPCSWFQGDRVAAHSSEVTGEIPSNE